MEKKIFLKSKKDQSLMRRHPWVFSGAIKAMEGQPMDGEIVAVHANKGRFLGKGMYSTQGSIAVRMLVFEDVEVGPEMFIDKLRTAWKVRANLGLTHSDKNEIFRLMHAEGDGIPGCIIDVYGDTAVLQAHALGVHKLRKELAQVILEVSEGRIQNVYDKSAETLPKAHRSEVENAYLIGGVSESNIFLEYGHRFHIDWVSGQKTGFFIDQRENRRYLSEIAKGKKILNTFCYTGGFSIYALVAGANTVHSLDSSEKALELVEKNIELNKERFSGEHDIIKADALEHLKSPTFEYDIIIIDPPAFAKGLKSRHNAIQGYKRLNGHAIRQIRPGGIIMTFSCSQVITQKIFRDTILSAAINEGRNVRVVGQLHQPADHPINIYHPEGEYLKGLVLEVD